MWAFCIKFLINFCNLLILLIFKLKFFQHLNFKDYPFCPLINYPQKYLFKILINFCQNNLIKTCFQPSKLSLLFHSNFLIKNSLLNPLKIIITQLISHFPSQPHSKLLFAASLSSSFQFASST